MGRAPCCDKANVKKGPWSPEEDATLKSYIDQHGTGGNWIALPQKIGLKRCGKSCRLRWLNYLRPNIRHGGFSEEEDNIICSLYISIGSRWSIIAAQLPGRTDNDIKNYWNTRLKKKLLGKQRKEKQAKGKQKSSGYNNNSFICQNPNQLPLVPVIPYSNNEPLFTDHTSIRKLLIKLGGRFSNSNQVDYEQLKHHYPTVNELVYTNTDATQNPNMVNSTSSAASSLENGLQFDMNVMNMNTMLQGSSSISLEAEFEQIICEGPHKLQGLEFFYDDILNSTRMDWGEMNTLGNFQDDGLNSNDGFLHGSTREEFVDDKTRYHL